MAGDALMLFDLLHKFADDASPHPPCFTVGMVVDLPAALPHGVEITARSVRWPAVSDGDLVLCGSCHRYMGECLNADCILPHRHTLIQRPDGRWVCRGGCDGGW